MEPRPEELAATLIRRARHRRAQDELRLSEARTAVEAELRTCLKEGVVGRAWLIGSGAWGGAHGRSDLDIVVEGLDSQGVGAVWDRLSEACGMDVDLLRFEELQRGFQKRVLADGVEVDGT